MQCQGLSERGQKSCASSCGESEGGPVFHPWAGEIFQQGHGLDGFPEDELESNFQKCV